MKARNGTAPQIVRGVRGTTLLGLCGFLAAAVPTVVFFRSAMVSTLESGRPVSITELPGMLLGIMGSLVILASACEANQRFDLAPAEEDRRRWSAAWLTGTLTGCSLAVCAAPVLAVCHQVGGLAWTTLTWGMARLLVGSLVAAALGLGLARTGVRPARAGLFALLLLVGLSIACALPADPIPQGADLASFLGHAAKAMRHRMIVPINLVEGLLAVLLTAIALVMVKWPR